MFVCFGLFYSKPSKILQKHCYNFENSQFYLICVANVTKLVKDAVGIILSFVTEQIIN